MPINLVVPSKEVIGPQGAQGPVGEDGEDGLQGPVGPQGIQGVPGPAGEDGPSGPQGIPGEDGEDGAMGPAGAAGSTGPQGVVGPAGLMGPQGFQAEDGEDGMVGPMGPAGGTNTAGRTITHAASPYTILASDDYLFVDTSGGVVTLGLPNPASFGYSKVFHVLDTTGNFDTNNCTLAPFSTEKIEGLAASKALQTNWGGWTVVTDQTDWYVF